MTTPDLLTTVGFEKGKIGSGEKEVGYQIKESSMNNLAGSAFACFAVMGLMVVSMVYDVHFEKKNLHRQLRQEEHHAAGKIAQVQMELWSQYRDDIQESNEAKSLLGYLEMSYSTFEGKLKSSISETAKEFNIEQTKAEKFADKILHLVADMQQQNVKHAKHLLDHLVSSGKKSVVLEKHVGKEMLREAKAEQKLIEEDGDVAFTPPTALGENETDSDEEDPMKQMLEGFWFTFNDYEGEFRGKVSENMHDGKPVYEQMKALQKRIVGPEPPSQTEIEEAMDKIDLASVGAGLGQGRVLPILDIIEEIVLIPKIPHKKLRALEEDWRKGSKDSMTVFEMLSEWHEQGLIPSGWLARGVEKEEKAQAQDLRTA